MRRMATPTCLFRRTNPSTNSAPIHQYGIIMPPPAFPERWANKPLFFPKSSPIHNTSEQTSVLPPNAPPYTIPPRKRARSTSKVAPATDKTTHLKKKHSNHTNKKEWIAGTKGIHRLAWGGESPEMMTTKPGGGYRVLASPKQIADARGEADAAPPPSCARMSLKTSIAMR